MKTKRRERIEGWAACPDLGNFKWVRLDVLHELRALWAIVDAADQYEGAIWGGSDLAKALDAYERDDE